MKLRGKIEATGTYTGKSKFDFWKNIQKGDVLTFEAKVTNEHSRGYATGMKAVNTRTQETMTITFAEAVIYLHKLPHTQID